ncbi:hypothetical protein SAMN05444390_1011494 [Marinobacterium lutimaris]|uniref:Haloacid dehalogenase-like hydrolase n=1 Tax=Marinobacterium lutimaris TaxID=568106 RepID=A0A1H5XT84_9GAMM|nr:hypothetical protein SAMN05444390_1011494 [Marinobacterium lutimaris]
MRAGVNPGARRYAPAAAIYVDVDATLLLGGCVNTTLVAWCRRQKAAGYSLVLWSSRGEAHARRAAKRAGAVDLFDAILSKPGYVVDDKQTRWMQYVTTVPVVPDADLPALQVDEA